MPTLAAYYGLHSKLWTRKFPHAANVLRRIQHHLEPIFERLHADAVLQRLLERTEAMHARDVSSGTPTRPHEIEREAEALGEAVAELEAATRRYGARASSEVSEWADRALRALRELHGVMATASRCLAPQRFDADVAA